MALTMDNASNDDTLKVELDAALKSSLSTAITQLRCFAHILNLGAQAALVELKSLIADIRKMIVRIRKSGKKRRIFAETCRQLGIKTKTLLLDVETRWNSTFHMLQRVIELRRVFI
jgi:hypothetical protein